MHSPTHSPTPWSIEKGRRGVIGITSPSCPVCRIPSIDDCDAAHIVQCVNAHEKLVEALRDLLKDGRSAHYNNARAALREAEEEV